ncbi:MAG: hypothetical protein M0R02_01065 [Bacteroidales bacterium]|nr:hypothetical protein [Bacteroidales bacterium]
MKVTTRKLVFYICIICMCISFKSFSQIGNRSLTCSFSKSDYKVVFDNRINLSYYFAASRFSRTGAFVKYHWVTAKNSGTSYATSFGLANNVYVLPFFGVSPSRFGLFVPIDIGFKTNIRTTISESDTFFCYAYGLGAQFYLFKKTAVFGQITNASFRVWQPYYTVGVAFVW